MFSYDFKFFPIPNAQGKTKAFASVIVDDVFEVSGFSIVEGSNGLFVSPPQDVKKKEDGSTDYIPKVRFHDQRDEGEKQSPLQKEMYTAMLEAWTNQNKPTGSSRQAAAQAQANKASGRPASPKEAMTPRTRQW